MKVRVGIAAVALVAAACSAGPNTLVVGESVRHPEPAPPTFSVLVLAGDNLAPIVGASVDFGIGDAATDATGAVIREWQDEGFEVEVRAAGFLPASLTLTTLPENPVAVNLDSVVLRGKVLTTAGDPLPGARVAFNGEEMWTNSFGTFIFNRAVPGSITVTRPAWLPTTVEWSGAPSTIEVDLEPRMVRALSVNGPSAGDVDVWNSVLELAETSGVNALVVDTKDEVGTVMHASKVTTAREIGAVRAFYDLGKVLRDMDERGLYKITRITTFQDTPMAEAYPELAARDAETGGIWRNNKGEAWMDPTDRGAWEYPLELAVEACEAGFDEIQFDYVRFPSDGPISRLALDGPYNETNRVATISAFLEEARSRLNPLGCAVAADIFAIVVSIRDDQGIGQRPEELSLAVDVLSPMIYPTHYGSGWLGLDNPNDHPSVVVGQALDSGLGRLQGPAIMRPWLQTSTYGAEEIKIEIGEAEQRGVGWMLWNSLTRHNPDALPPPETE